MVEAGDSIELIERHHPEWNVARVFGLLISGQSKRDQAELLELSLVNALAQSWMQRARKLMLKAD